MPADHIYSVLIVSASAKFNLAVSTLFPSAQYWPVDMAENPLSARQKMQENSYDIVVINSPLKEETGTRLAANICSTSSSCVMMLVNKESYDDVSEAVSEYGVEVIQKLTIYELCMTIIFRLLQF